MSFSVRIATISTITIAIFTGTASAIAHTYENVSTTSATIVHLDADDAAATPPAIAPDNGVGWD